MLKKSFFVNIIINIYKFFISLIEKSFSWRFLKKCNGILNKSARKSVVVNAVSSETTTDKAYGLRIGKLFAVVSAFFKNIFLWLADSARKSSVISFLSDLCHSLIQIRLKNFGCTFFMWGIIALLGSLVFSANFTKVIICALITFAGVILLLLNKSIVELFADSALFGRLVCNKSGNSVRIINCDVRCFLIAGAFLGILSLIFGIVPVAVAVVLLIVATVGFYFTWQVALIYVCVLPFMPTMAMVGGGLAIFLCIAVKSVLGYNSKLFSKSYVLNMYLLFMGVAFFLAALFSYARNSSIKIALVYIAFLLVTYALIRILSERKILFTVLNGISLCSIPVSLFGIYQHFTGFDKQNTWVDTEMFEDISGRVVSFFGNPNVFGEYLILVILTSAICFFISKSYKFKAIHLFAIASSALSLVYTYSRGCWIGLVFAVVIFLFLSKRKIFLAFCVLGAISVFFLPDSIITRIASVGNLADSSTSYRVYIWEGTLNMLKDFWITGIGLGTDAFNAVYPFYAYSAITAPHPHNLYLVILTETGVVGAFAFLLIILLYYKKLFAVIKYSEDVVMQVISSGLIAAMSGFLLQGMFDNVWYNYRVFLLFWIYIALGAAVDIVFRRNKV